MKGESRMTIQPNYVNEELLHELSESFRLNSQIPPELYSRYRIKRGLRHRKPLCGLCNALYN